MKKIILYLLATLLTSVNLYSQVVPLDAAFTFDTRLSYRGHSYNPNSKTYETEYIKSPIEIGCYAKIRNLYYASVSAVSPSVSQSGHSGAPIVEAKKTIDPVTPVPPKRKTIDIAKYKFSWTVSDEKKFVLARLDGDGEAFGQFKYTFNNKYAKLTIRLELRYEAQTHVYQEEIEITKVYLAALGDSIFSGEGNPDIPREDVKFVDINKESTSQVGCWNSTGSVFWRDEVQELSAINRNVPSLPINGESPRSNQVYWQEPMAHRSNKAIPTRVAFKLYYSPKVGNLTKIVVPIMLNLARTGSGVHDGVLQPNKGLESWKNQSQIDELKEIMDRTGIRIDFLLLSLGANELDWVSKLSALVNHNDGDVIKNKVEKPAYAAIENLSNQFTELSVALRIKIKPQNVLLAEYPTGLFDRFDRNGQPTIELYDDRLLIKDQYVCPCGIFKGLGDIKSLTKGEVRVMKEIATALNAKLKAISQANNWIFAEGVAAAYAGHGYCEKSTFYVSASASCKRQSDFAGTLHPNEDGINVTATIISDIIRGRIINSSSSLMKD
jgi:hypothetical protein